MKPNCHHSSFSPFQTQKHAKAEQIFLEFGILYFEEVSNETRISFGHFFSLFINVIET